MSISGARFLGSSFALVSAWLLCNATLALADPFPDTTKPHFCKNTPTEHVDYPPPTAPGGYEQMPNGTSYTWKICAQQSGATEWYFVVKNGTTTVCQVPWNDPKTPQIETLQATDGFSFTCSTTLLNLYTASVYWKVASSPFMNHSDYLFKP